MSVRNGSTSNRTTAWKAKAKISHSLPLIAKAKAIVGVKISAAKAIKNPLTRIAKVFTHHSELDRKKLSSNLECHLPSASPQQRADRYFGVGFSTMRDSDDNVSLTGLTAAQRRTYLIRLFDLKCFETICDPSFVPSYQQARDLSEEEWYETLREAWEKTRQYRASKRDSAHM
ncbi:hypothetical protein MMC08_003665 [Hypocenomyce scalaris]|nr:hypothetical protein [Hypocenomyce scalaris]